MGQISQCNQQLTGYTLSCLIRVEVSLWWTYILSKVLILEVVERHSQLNFGIHKFQIKPSSHCKMCGRKHVAIARPSASLPRTLPLDHSGIVDIHFQLAFIHHIRVACPKGCCADFMTYPLHPFSCNAR